MKHAGAPIAVSSILLSMALTNGAGAATGGELDAQIDARTAFVTVYRGGAIANTGCNGDRTQSSVVVGSGFVVSTVGAIYLLTAKHVVSGWDTSCLFVALGPNQRGNAAGVRFYGNDNDWAILKIPIVSPPQPLPRGRYVGRDFPVTGAYAVGFPSGGERKRYDLTYESTQRDGRTLNFDSSVLLTEGMSGSAVYTPGGALIGVLSRTTGSNSVSVYPIIDILVEAGGQSNGENPIDLDLAPPTNGDSEGGEVPGISRGYLVAKLGGTLLSPFHESIEPGSTGFFFELGKSWPVTGWDRGMGLFGVRAGLGWPEHRFDISTKGLGELFMSTGGASRVGVLLGPSFGAGRLESGTGAVWSPFIGGTLALEAHYGSGIGAVIGGIDYGAVYANSDFVTHREFAWNHAISLYAGFHMYPN